MEPLLQELEAAGAGINVDGENILGFAWSDDLMMLVEEDKLDKVLRCLEQASGKYRKKTNDTKVFVTPLCPKKKNVNRPPLHLGGKPLKYKEEERILGFMLSQQIQGGRAYAKRLNAKADIAIAKIEKIGASSGHLVRPEITEKYYKSMLLPVLTANLGLPQLDSPDGNMHGYELARQATAKVIRRMLATSGHTSPGLLIAEAGWDLPDLEIIKAKLRLMDRLQRRAHQFRHQAGQETPERQDGPSHVLRQRIIDVEQGETKGLCAEVKRLWHEADMPQKWPPNIDQHEYTDDTDAIQQAAERISLKVSEYSEYSE